LYQPLLFRQRARKFSAGAKRRLYRTFDGASENPIFAEPHHIVR